MVTAAALLMTSLAAGTTNPTDTAGSVRPRAAAPPAGTAPSVAATSRCSTEQGSAPSGWRRVMADSFSEDIPLGEWGKPGGRWEFPGGKWRARTAGYKDTSGRGTYNSPKTTTQHHGALDVWIHSEGSTRYVAAPIPLVGNTVGQRISLCMRADQIPGYKIAFLLWPDEGPGNYHGEIDFPEGKLLSTGSAHAFMHFDPKPSSGKQQDAYDSNVSLMSWHTYTMEWHPGQNEVSFYVDGRLIGRSARPEVPDGPMHYVMQMETYVPGQELPPPAEGHVLVDWFTIDVPSGAGLPFTDISDSPHRNEIVALYKAGITKGCTSTWFCPRGRVLRDQLASFLDRVLDPPATNADYFDDDDGNLHEGAINRLAAAGITTGCAARRYCPDDPVRRDQMASFLRRAFDLSPAQGDFFSDDAGNLHEKAINAAAKADITSGCSATRYCPGRYVTREQMAAFLVRAMRNAGLL